MVTARFYLWAVGAAVLAGLVLAILYYRGEAISATAERDRLKTDLATVRAVNDMQKAVMERLTALRSVDDKLMVDLQARLSELTQQTEQATDAIRDLEKTSADVRAYLAAPVPAELRRMLNNRASRGAASPNQ